MAEGKKDDGMSDEPCVAEEDGMSAGEGSGVESIAGEGSSDGTIEGVTGGESLATDLAAGVCDGEDIVAGKAELVASCKSIGDA